MEHDFDRGWHRYGFDNLPFAERAIHGADVPVQLSLAIHRGLMKPHISFLIIEPSGEDEAIGMHIHRDVPSHTELEEWYVIIEGDGIMTFSNGDSVAAGPGDLLATYPGTGHSFRATGDKPVRLVSITPLMFTSKSPVDDAPSTFTPRIYVSEVDATMNPLHAECSDCSSGWTRPEGDLGASTLPRWAREHACGVA